MSYLRDEIRKKHDNLARSIKITVEPESKSAENKKKEKWRVSNLDVQVFNDIQAEHEINLINSEPLGNEKNSPKNQEHELNTNDAHLLEVKGIKEYTDKIDPEILNSRICMGFLEKKRKKLCILQKRWCILISAKPFISRESALPEVVPPFQEILLTDDQLPPWMELDTIFYFQYKSNDDRSPFIRKIPLRNFVSVILQNNPHSEDSNEGYSFKLNTRERKFVFKAELITEMNKWITAIEGSRKNYLETHHQQEDNETASTVTHHKVHIRENAFGKATSQTNNEDNIDKSSDSGREEFITKVRSSTAKSLEKCETPPRMSLGSREDKSIGKEGYLLKKSMHKFNKLLGWEKRYVSLKNDLFFWSISNTNIEVRNTIKLSEIEKCEKVKVDQFVLAIGKKIYKFRADNQEDRDRWFSLIKKGISLLPIKEETPNLKSKKSESEEMITPNLSCFYKNKSTFSQIIEAPDISPRETMASITKEDEDTIFARFFLLCEKDGFTNKKEDEKKRENEAKKGNYLFHQPTKESSCIYKYLCCCLAKQEEDYYSHF